MYLFIHLSNENIFRFTGPLWGESTSHRCIPPVTDGCPSQRPVTRSFDVFFDLRLCKRLSKQSRRRYFETPSRSCWRHCNVHIFFTFNPYYLHRIMSTSKLLIWSLVISCMCMCVAPSLSLHGFYTPWTIRKQDNSMTADALSNFGTMILWALVFTINRRLFSWINNKYKT